MRAVLLFVTLAMPAAAQDLAPNPRLQECLNRMETAYLKAPRTAPFHERMARERLDEGREYCVSRIPATIPVQRPDPNALSPAEEMAALQQLFNAQRNMIIERGIQVQPDFYGVGPNGR